MRQARKPAGVALILMSLLGGCAQAVGDSRVISTVQAVSPRVDHHVHIWSANAARLLQGPSAAPAQVPQRAITADEVVADLDRAGVRRTVVLSVAYWFVSPRMPVQGQGPPQLHAENDWVADQAARHPLRLVAFCSFNPITADAMAELARCAADRRFKGIKLHLGNSGVDLLNPEHVEQLGNIFAELDRRRLPVVVHLWTGPGYGRKDSEAFLNGVLARAPRIPVQIAHFSGTGPGYGPDEAVAVYADAIAFGDRRLRNVYFDVASTITKDQTPEQLALIARRVREIGVSKILFGSDSARGFNDPAGPAWQRFLRLPLTEREFRAIATNTAPYLR